MDDIGSGYAGDESDLASPMDRKRKYGVSNSPDLAQHLHTSGEWPPHLEQSQHSYGVKQEETSQSIPEVDLYDASDRETDRRGASLRKRVRRQSPPLKHFKTPLDVDMLFPQSSGLEEGSQFPIRSRSKAINFKEPSLALKQKSESRESFLNHNYNTLSPGSDSDGIEIIETPNGPKNLPIKSRNESLAK